MVRDKKDKYFGSVVIHSIFIILALVCIIPVILVVSVSLSSQSDIVNYGYTILPKHITFDAYNYILKSPKRLLSAYYVSGFVTILGGFLSITISSMLAYPISRPDFKYRKPMTLYIFFTMLFGGGLIPWYMLISKMKLPNTIWVLILPYLIIPLYVLLLRTYFQKVPISIIESAKIDGCSEFRNFFTMVIPLSKPAIATVGLFILLFYWNDWYLSLLFITKIKLTPLQFMLYNMMENAKYLATAVETRSMAKFPSESMRMGMCLVAAGPMLFIFPFFQKYFVKGLTVGSIKG